MGTASRVRLAGAAWVACAAFGCEHIDLFPASDSTAQVQSHPEDVLPSREDIQDQRARSLQNHLASQGAKQPAR